jgi:branched-chain amino acid transport system permease protein
MIRLSTDETRTALVGAAAVALAATLPLFDQGFYLTLSVNIMLYAALCTAWTLFSGPTHYISLATAAFFGLGTYAVALGIDLVAFPILVAAGGAVAALLAGLVGAATLRISGVYFVIFTFGLAELVRQIVSWTQIKLGARMGLYIFTDFTESHIYWMLLALTVVIFIVGWLISRSRLGFAMQIIGNDEEVARHSGIDTARLKIILFMISGAFIGMAGAILAPRYSYVEPPGAFNPMISFLVVVMALLGGMRRLWGPLVGVIPFTIVMEFVSARFPNDSSIVIGITFLVIVYALPNGVTGRLEQLLARIQRTRTASGSVGTAVSAKEHA